MRLLKYLTLFLLFLSSSVFAGHTGWQSPTAANNATTWANETNVYTSNDARASFDQFTMTSYYFYSTIFGLIVTNDVQIDSVIVRVEGYGTDATAANRVVKVALTMNGTAIQGDEVSATLPLAAGENTASPVEVRGVTNGVWGATGGLTEDEVTASTFGVAVKPNVVDLEDGVIYIDHVQVLVYYANAGTDYLALDGQNGGATDMLDTFIDSLNPDIEKGSETYMYAFGTSGGDFENMLMKFDLTGVSGTVNWVSLDLFRKLPITRSPQLDFYRLTRDWLEDQATWNIASTGVNWTTKGGDFDATKIDSLTDTLPSTGKTFVYCQRGEGVGLAQLVQDWVDGTYPNYGILIKAEVSTNDTVSVSTAGNINEILNPRPKLFIEYTPAAAGLPDYRHSNTAVGLRHNNTEVGVRHSQ
jgi:hypothetical protein